MSDHDAQRSFPRDQRQATVFAWAKMAFGEAEASSLPQRGLRLLEEAIEAFQACGGDEAIAHKLVTFVFARPAGTVGQELGGVAVTTLALAAAAGLSADEEECREVHRVLNKPVREFSERNASKNAAGFLVAAPTMGSTDKPPSMSLQEAVERQDAQRALRAEWDQRAQDAHLANPTSLGDVWAGTTRPSTATLLGEKRNSCCGNSGTHGEGGRQYCSTCGKEIS